MRSSSHASVSGSPPRVRSRLAGPILVGRAGGITSACAEQTLGLARTFLRRRDHLRVCGADHTGDQSAATGQGSPPRVRSRPEGQLTIIVQTGITSACAEQTYSEEAKTELPGDHLRVCGADRPFYPGGDYEAGSPPRVRSRPRPAVQPIGEHGITSACAEQTRRSSASISWMRDHLRVCGADGAVPVLGGVLLGSPPRVRSRQLYFTVF